MHNDSDFIRIHGPIAGSSVLECRAKPDNLLGVRCVLRSALNVSPGIHFIHVAPGHKHYMSA